MSYIKNIIVRNLTISGLEDGKTAVLGDNITTLMSIDYYESIFEPNFVFEIRFVTIENALSDLRLRGTERVNIEIEHHIISAGITEMIYGCSFSKAIKQIYACSYYYRENGVVWPKLSVNFTAKTQFLYRIHKGTFEMSDQHSVNAKVEEENINIPFNHMVFFGDGETDIPSFRIVSGGGGCSVCVYDPLKEKSKKIANQLVQDQRVQYAVKNDYSEGEELDTVIKNFILSL